jgi:hypothetical protein
MVTTRSATKRKREAVDGPASDVSSASQLERSSLRLTPQRQNPPKSRSSEREDDAVAMDQSIKDSKATRPSP